MPEQTYQGCRQYIYRYRRIRAVGSTYRYIPTRAVDIHTGTDVSGMKTCIQVQKFCIWVVDIQTGTDVSGL